MTRGERAWLNMHARCKPDAKEFRNNYYCRGISVCGEWFKLEKFLSDMGEPSEGDFLDRTDNDKGYTKSNCCWVDQAASNRNKRNVTLYSYAGQRLTLGANCR